MKYLVVVLILSFCIAGLNAKKAHMGNYGFDQFCPHRPRRCNWYCKDWGFTEGKCLGHRNRECWCFWYGRKPSFAGKRKIAHE
ncbi:uncharacterized protein [Mytilus edulis]|uniref:uncharacterized protein n=1 Tax=Mytilus edulis TaxID=6550 RepID=UPI0039EF4A21